MCKAIYWLGNMTRLNDIGVLNIEVKHHQESQSRKRHYQSKSFFKKNSHIAWLTNE